MRVGIFGGTFDPVHLGHLILAEQARDFARLDEVWFVPAPRPPQKDTHAVTRFDARLDMLELAIAGNPTFRIDTLEKERDGPSYTADTLAALKARYASHAFFLLLGGDALLDLPGWYQPQRIVRAADLVVMARPGTPLISADELSARLGTPVALEVVPAPRIDIASRDIRRRVIQGRTIRYLVPRAVEVYIREKKLYSL